MSIHISTTDWLLQRNQDLFGTNTRVSLFIEDSDREVKLTSSLVFRNKLVHVST